MEQKRPSKESTHAYVSQKHFYWLQKNTDIISHLDTTIAERLAISWRLLQIFELPFVEAMFGIRRDWTIIATKSDSESGDWHWGWCSIHCVCSYAT